MAALAAAAFQAEQAGAGQEDQAGEETKNVLPWQGHDLNAFRQASVPVWPLRSAFRGAKNSMCYFYDKILDKKKVLSF